MGQIEFDSFRRKFLQKYFISYRVIGLGSLELDRTMYSDIIVIERNSMPNAYKAVAYQPLR